MDKLMSRWPLRGLSRPEIHMGSLAGKAWTEMEEGSELKRKHRSIQFDYSPYGGESADGVEKRVVGFLREIKSKHGVREILIITHGGIIRLLHLLEHGIPMADEKIDHVSVLTFDLDRILSRLPGKAQFPGRP